MKSPRRSKQHMRCPHDGCRKRFKGQAGDVCPVCDKPAKVDAWANSKPWRSRLCYCDGPLVVDQGTTQSRHRRMPVQEARR